MFGGGMPPGSVRTLQGARSIGTAAWQLFGPHPGPDLKMTDTVTKAKLTATAELRDTVTETCTAWAGRGRPQWASHISLLSSQGGGV